MARGDTDPTEQILELPYSRDKQAAISSSIVHEELGGLTGCRERRSGLRSEVRVCAQAERNVRRVASGAAFKLLASGCTGSTGGVAAFVFERRCSVST